MKFQKYRIQQRKSTIKSKKGRLVRARLNLITLYLCLASISIKISYILPMTGVDKNTQTTTGAPHTFKVPQRVATTLANVVIKRSWAKEAPWAWLHFSKRRFRKQPFFFFFCDKFCWSHLLFHLIQRSWNLLMNTASWGPVQIRSSPS